VLDEGAVEIFGRGDRRLKAYPEVQNWVLDGDVFGCDWVVFIGRLGVIGVQNAALEW